MKAIKSYKTIMLTAVLVLLVALSFGMVNFNVRTANAAALAGADYFTLNGQAADELQFDGEALSVPVSISDKVSVKNKLVADDMEIVLNIPEEITVFTMQLTADAFDANGNKNTEGAYDYAIVNKLQLSLVQDEYTVEFNGISLTNVAKDASNQLTVRFAVEDNYLVLVAVNGTNYSAKSSDAYYKLKVVDKCLVNVDFIMTDTTAEDVAFKVISIDQMASDSQGTYKQAFVIDQNAGAFESVAYPRISLTNSFDGFYGDSTNENTVLKGKIYANLNIYAYSVLGNVTKDMYLESADSDVHVVNKKSIQFNGSGAQSFTVAEGSDSSKKVYETFNVYTTATAEDTKAPEYKDFATAEAQSAKQAIETYIDEHIYSDKENGVYVAIGDNSYLDLPSFKSLVSDDVNSYENLSATVYYRVNNSTPTSTSTMRIPLKTEGEYVFFVLFADQSNNSIESNKFFETDENDENLIIEKELYDYVFFFSIEDNHPMQVKPAEKQGNGYVGVSYTATAFDITSSSYNISYTLYYSEVENATEDQWHVVPTASEFASVEQTYFTEADVKAINYNDNMTFTPDRIGYYKIVCEISSSTVNRSAQGETQVIKVLEQSSPVYPDNHWLENNVLSVVFLSIGTVCLIGIIVLLCIKPKDKDNE